MTTPPSQAAIVRLIASDAIRAVLARYCHAIDRCDADLLRGVYWPEGTDDHGIYNGSGQGFADFVMPMLGTMERTVHHALNVMIDFTGEDRAKVQSYCIAYHEWNGQELIVGSRFLDEFERRGDEWRILERVSILDWNQQRPTTSDWREDGMFATLRYGRRLPDDASVEWRAKPFGAPLSFKKPAASAA